MNRQLWKRILPCLLAALILLCSGFALADGGASMTGSVTATLESATVARGEFLIVDVEAVEGAEYYFAKVFESDGVTPYGEPAIGAGAGGTLDLTSWGQTHSADDPIYLQTATLPAGSYTVKVFSEVERTPYESDPLPFTVTANSSASVCFRVSNTEPLWGEVTCLSVYAPGAQRIYLRTANEVYDRFDGESWRMNVGFGSSESHEYWVVAEMPDGSAVTSNPVTVTSTVLADAGTISITGGVEDEMPAAAFTVSFNAVPNEALQGSAKVGIYLHDIASGDSCYQNNAIDPSAGSVTIPLQIENDDGETVAVLQPGHAYELEAYLFTYGVGYREVRDSFTFMVPAEEIDERVNITVNGEDGVTDQPRHGGADICISAPGATAVRFINGDDMEDLTGWWGDGGWSEFNRTGEIHFGWGHWEDRMVCAEACFDEDPEAENAVWVRSNTVLVRRTVADTMNKPTISTAQATVERGQFLEISITDWDDRCEWAYYQIHGAQGNWGGDGDFDPFMPEYGIPTAALEPGLYTLCLNNSAEGYQDSDFATLVFTVTEGEYDGDEPLLTISATEIETLDKIFVDAYAPGAERLAVYIYKTDSNDRGDPWREDGEDLNFWFMTGWPGEYEVVAEAFYQGQDDPVELHRTFTASAPNGSLHGASITAPTAVNLADGVTFTIGAVEHAEWYYVSVRNECNGYQWGFSFEDAGEHTLSPDRFYDEGLREGDVYSIWVDAHAAGYESDSTGNNRSYFYCGNGGSVQLSLSVDGESSDAYVHANTGVPVSIVLPELPDGQRITRIEFFNWDRWDEFWGEWYDHALRTESSDFDAGGDGGDRFAVARAWVQTGEGDDDGYWLGSNCVTVHVESNGELTQPDLTIQNPEITAGEPLHVTLGEVENASEYHLRIQNRDDDFEYMFFYATPGDYELPTGMLAEGDYRVTVSVRGTPGWSWGGNEAEFHVAGGEPVQGIYFATTNAEAFIGQEIGFIAYAPGAEFIRIYDHEDLSEDDGWWDERGGEYFHSGPIMWDEGEHTFWARACYGGDNWSEMSEPVTVNVIRGGWLPAPGLTVSATVLNEGDALTLTIGEVDGAAGYSFRLDDHSIEWGDPNIYAMNMLSAGEYEIPASVFKADGTYTLIAHAYRNGFDRDEARVSLVVRPAQITPTATLTVNGSTADQTVRTWAGSDIAVQLPDIATAVAVWDGYDWDYRDLGEDHLYTENFGYNAEIGPHTVIAKYTTTPLPRNGDGDIDWDNLHWNELDWTGWSNAVTINVVSEADLPEFAIAVPEVLARGDFLRVQIDTSELDAFFNDHVLYSDYWFNGGADGSDHAYDWDGSCIYIPTASLEPGQHNVYVNSYAEGYMGSTANVSFIVIVPEGGYDGLSPILSFTSTALQTEDSLMFNAYVPERIIYDEDEYESAVEWCNVTVFKDGDEEPYNDGWNPWWCEFTDCWSVSEVGSYQFVLVAKLEGREDAVELLRRTVTVTAPNGDLGPVTVEADAVFEPDGSVTFTLSGDENTEWYYVDIYCYDWGRHVYGGNFYGPGTYTIQPWEIDGGLRENHSYHIGVSAHAHGYNATWNSAPFICMAGVSDALTLTLNGEARDAWTVVNTDVTFDIHLDGALPSRIDIYNGNGNDWWGWLDGDACEGLWNGHILRQRSDWGNEGDRFVMVRAWYLDYDDPINDENDQWHFIVSNPVRLHVMSENRVEAPAFSLENTTVARGDDLVVNITAVDHASNYGVDIWQDGQETEDGWEDGFWTNFWATSGEVRLPTAMLEPGEYYINVFANGETGWSNANSDGNEQTFTVTEGGEFTPGTIYVSVNKTALTTGETVVLSAYAPGAERVRFMMNNSDWEWNGWQQEEEGEFIRSWHGRSNEDVLRFSVSAWYPGAEDWSEPTGFTTVSFTAPQSLGEFNAALSATVLNEDGDAMVEDLMVTVYAIEHAENYWINIEDTPFDNCRTGNFEMSFTPTADGLAVITIPGSILTPGHTYKVNLHADAEGYLLTTKDLCFVVKDVASGEVPESAFVTVDGSTEDQDILIHTGHRVIADAPENATAIAIYDGEGNWYFEPGSHAEYDWGWGNPREALIYARYTTDLLPLNGDGDIDWDTLHWNDFTWIGDSNTIRLNVQRNGYMPAAEINVPASVARGEFLDIEITNMDAYVNGVYVDAAAFRKDAPYPFPDWRGWDGEGHVYLPTADLEPGRYTLYVDANSQAGYDRTRTYAEFTVTESAYNGEDAILTLSKTSVTTEVNVDIFVYAPGAEWAKVCVYRNGDEENPWDWWDWGGDRNDRQWSINCEGSYEFTAFVKYPNEELREAAPRKTLVVSAPNGSLDDTTVAFTAETFAPGENVTFTISEVENAGWYWVCVRNENWGGEWYFTFDEAGQHTIGANELDGLHEDCVYSVRVDPHATGYNGSGSNKAYFFCTHGETGALTLTLNGEAQDAWVTVNADVTLEVLLEGGTPNRLEWYNGNGTYWQGLTDGSDLWNGRYIEQHRDWGNEGDRFVMVRAWYLDYDDPDNDENDQWHFIVSNPVRLHVMSENRVEAPAFSLENTTVARGDDLVVNITAVDHASNYGVDIWQDGHETENGWEDGFWTDFWGLSSGEIRLPTAMLEPGEYYINAFASGETGWSNANSDGNEQTFTVTEGGGFTPGTIYVSTNKTALTTGETVVLSAYAPGAERVRFMMNNSDWEWNGWYQDDDGEFIRTWHSRSNEDVLRFSVSAWYPGAEDWSEPTGFTTVSFTASQSLDRINATLSSTVLQPGEDLTVDVTAVANAERYYVNVEDVTGHYTSNYRLNFEAPATITIPGSLFTPGHVYKVNLDAEADGYQNAYNSYGFMVKDNNVTAAATVTIDGSTADQEIFVNENVHVDVTAPAGATAVSLYDGNNGWDFRTGNGFEVDWNWGEARVAPIYARYTYDPMPQNDEEWSSFDWNNVHWEGVSNIVTVTVVKLGDAPEAQATVPEAVTRGAVLTVTIDNAAELEGYGVNAAPYYAPENRWFGRWYNWNGQTISIPTGDLEAGKTYTLYIDVHGGPGYERSEIAAQFTVNEPQGIVFNISAAAVQTREDVAMSAYAPGANAITLLNYGERWDGWDGDFFADSWNFGNSEVFEFSVIAHYGDEWEDGAGWSEPTEAKTLTVTAPNGRMPYVEANVTTAWAGEDVAVSWSFDGDYDHIDFHVNRYGSWEHMWGCGIDGGQSGVITVPAYGNPNWNEPEVILEAGQRYWFCFDVHKAGYEASHMNTLVTVLNAGEQSGVITVTANGESERLTVPCNENIHIVVTAPSNAKGIQLCLETGWVLWSGDEMNENNEVSFDWAPGGAGGFPLYARYSTVDLPGDDFNWHSWESWNSWEGWIGTSSVIQVNTTVSNYLPAPVFEVPGQVTRGEQLVAHLIEEARDAEYGASIRDYYSNEWICGSGYDSSASTFTFDTIMLKPGLYRLQVDTWNNDEPGYEGISAAKIFEVTEAEGIIFSVSKTTLKTYEEADIIACVPGAVRISLSIWNTDDPDNIQPFWGPLDENGDPVWEDGDAFQATTHFGGHSGSRSVLLLAQYENGDVEERRINVTVTADGTLPDPVITAPESLIIGEDLNFTVDVDEGYWWWFATLHDVTEGIPDEEVGMEYWGDETHEDETHVDFNVSADRFTAGHWYEIRVYAARAEWNDADIYYYFCVEDPYSGSVLRLPASLRVIEEEAFAYTPARTVVIPNGATTIGAYAFQGCGNLRYVVIPDSVTSIDPNAFAGCGDLIFICSGNSAAADFARSAGYTIQDAN